ncbi:hypothetical protein D3C78_1200240 [compost metagenome]
MHRIGAPRRTENDLRVRAAMKGAGLEGAAGLAERLVIPDDQSAGDLEPVQRLAELTQRDRRGVGITGEYPLGCTGCLDLYRP